MLSESIILTAALHQVVATYHGDQAYAFDVTSSGVCRTAFVQSDGPSALEERQALQNEMPLSPNMHELTCKLHQLPIKLWHCWDGFLMYLILRGGGAGKLHHPMNLSLSPVKESLICFDTILSGNAKAVHVQCIMQGPLGLF